MKILHCGEDAQLAAAVTSALEKDGFFTDTCQSPEDVEGYLYFGGHEALVFTTADLSGGRSQGFLRLARMRSMTRMPILVLSPVPDIRAKVRAFETGADDYVVPPFHQYELRARLKSLIRRANGHAVSQIAAGPVVVDLDRKEVRVNGRKVHLPRREYDLLELLALRRERLVNKGMLLNMLYGGRDEPEAKIIDVYLCRLRKLLREAGSGADKCIQTVWGRGYIFSQQPFLEGLENVA